MPDPLKIEIPRNEKGLGNIILQPNSADLIEGVVARPFPLWPDDRGYFLEIARLTEGLVAEFPAKSQVSAAVNYPGIIKAFHYHLKQTDFWVPVAGMLQVALVDLRPESRTYGRRNTLYLGSLRPWHLVIPPGVGHGYKVIGEAPSTLVYLTNQIYDPSDEGRIAYDDAGIAYDWELQHK